jgi:hypothetical protein
MCEALGSIPSTKREERKGGKKGQKKERKKRQYSMIPFT